MLWQHSRQLLPLNSAHGLYSVQTKKFKELPNISRCYMLIWYVICCWLPWQNPFNFFLTCSSTANYLFSPFSEHKVLGIGELWGTGMLLYLAWPGMRGPANCPAPPHTLTCGHSGMHTHSHAHKASVATETWFRVSNPSHQSAVLTNGTLSSSCQEKK